jgi:hypothetical protein
MRLLTLFAFSLALSAAMAAQDPNAAPPPAPAKPQPQGTLHIYRYKLEVAHAKHPAVSCDNFPIVRIQNGRIYSLKVSTGRHTLLVADNPDPLDIDVEVNKDYYIRVDYPINAAPGARPALVLVPPAQARDDIKGLRRLDGQFVEAATCGRP